MCALMRAGGGGGCVGDNGISILFDIYLQNLFSRSVAGLLHMQVDYLQ